MVSEHAGTAGMASLELLWGDTQRPSRGPKPKLSIGQIAAAAIAIADAEGLDAVSMQRVAGDLGFTTMSLYRYVPAKEQLLEVMLDIACGQAPTAREDAGWRSELERWVRELWAVYLRHPWALRVQLSGPPVGPNQLSWFEAALRPLSEAGLGPGEMVSTATYLTGSVRELATISVDLAQARDAAGMSATEAEAGFASALRNYVDAEKFPTLAGLVEQDVFEPVVDTTDLDVDLEFGVQRLLDGIEAYVQRGT